MWRTVKSRLRKMTAYLALHRDLTEDEYKEYVKDACERLTQAESVRYIDYVRPYITEVLEQGTEARPELPPGQEPLQEADLYI